MPQRSTVADTAAHAETGPRPVACPVCGVVVLGEAACVVAILDGPVPDRPEVLRALVSDYRLVPAIPRHLAQPTRGELLAGLMRAHTPRLRDCPGAGAPAGLSVLAELDGQVPVVSALEVGP